jgi:hypothetical protein
VVVDGQCRKQVCQPGQVVCTPAGVPEECNAVGSGWTVGPPCKPPASCPMGGSGCTLKPTPPKCPCGGLWPRCEQC